MRKFTIQNISQFEYVISLIGLMGKGKTSLSVGIITDLTEIIKNNINDKINDIRMRLYYIDFDKFENDFRNYLKENFEKNDFLIFKTIDKYLKEKDILGFNTNFIDTESVFIMLVKYCILDYCLNIRGIITYSKGYLFNRATNNNALILDDKGLEMVCAISENIWQFELGVIYFDDEIQITRGNVNSNSKLYKINGLSITLALIRNMSLGTTYRITTKQLANNEEFQNRSLTGTNIEIENVSPCYTSKFLRKIIDGIDDHIKNTCLFYKKLEIKTFNLFHKNNKIDVNDELNKFEKQNNLWRKFHYFIQMLSRYLYSNGYNLYRLRIYKNSDDIGKENTKQQKYYEKIKLLMPINVVFGNYDTYEYFYKLIMLEQYSTRIINVSTSSTNHDIVNMLFMDTLNDFIKTKNKIESR